MIATMQIVCITWCTGEHDGGQEGHPPYIWLEIELAGMKIETGICLN